MQPHRHAQRDWKRVLTLLSETVFSMIKRRLGPTLGAHTYWRQNRAMTLKAISHNILILLWILRVSTEQVGSLKHGLTAYFAGSWQIMTVNPD